MKPQSVRRAFAMFLLVGLYAVGGTGSEVFACDIPPMTAWYRIFLDSWQPNSNVHVFIDSRFNTTDRSQLAQGLIN
jgi:hypothetical protein